MRGPPHPQRRLHPQRGTEPEEADKPRATNTGQFNSLSTVTVVPESRLYRKRNVPRFRDVYRRCPERVFKVRLGIGPGPAAAPPLVKLLQELMPFSNGTRFGVRFGSNGFFGAPYHGKLAPVGDPCETH